MNMVTAKTTNSKVNAALTEGFYSISLENFYIAPKHTKYQYEEDSFNTAVTNSYDKYSDIEMHHLWWVSTLLKGIKE